MGPPPTFENAYARAAEVSKLIQGEVVQVADACVVVAEASAPLTVESAAVAHEMRVDQGLILVPNAADQVVVLTQTCDLQTTDVNDRTCLVAPVVQATPELAREALRGRRPSLAGLPWLSSTAVADLTRITTVERSVLVGVPSNGRPRTPRERFHFSESVHRFLTRSALPDEVNLVLAPFVRRLAEKNQKQSPEGACVRQVAEMRVQAVPDLDAPQLALIVLLVLEVSDLPTVGPNVELDQDRIDGLVASGESAAAAAVLAALTPTAAREAWTALGECWGARSSDSIGDARGVDSLEVEVLNVEDLSYARSLDAPIIDIRYLSSRPN